MKSLYISALGMINQQINVDVISNNLANINTPGYKKSEINFTDVYFQNNTAQINLNNNVQNQNNIQNQENINRVDLNSFIGLGSKTSGVTKIFTQGTLQSSENPLDLAIEGDGFFGVLLPDGKTGYTRDGSFRIDANGNIVNVQGYKLQPPINIKQSFEDITITTNGEIYITPLGSEEQIRVGKIIIYNFINPSGLQSLSDNIYIETVASGAPIQLNQGYSILQGFKEMSNVNVIEEMVNMIAAQRAYEISSKAVKTSDEMMQVRNNLR